MTSRYAFKSIFFFFLEFYFIIDEWEINGERSIKYIFITDSLYWNSKKWYVNTSLVLISISRKFSLFKRIYIIWTYLIKFIFWNISSIIEWWLKMINLFFVKNVFIFFISFFLCLINIRLIFNYFMIWLANLILADQMIDYSRNRLWERILIPN